MRPLEATRPDRIRDDVRAMRIAFGCVISLFLARMLFCWLAPEVLSGSTGLRSDLRVLSLSVCLATGGFYYLCLRNEPYLALLLFLPAFFFLGGGGGYRTQYILFHVGRQFPLVDETLAEIDRTLGFNWISYFRWIVDEPSLHGLLQTAYSSIWFQPVVLAVIQIVRKDFIGFSRLHMALPLSFAFLCCVATFLPAVGAYDFHDMKPEMHEGVSIVFTDGATAPLVWLRQPMLPQALPDFPDLRVLTFPSWHAAVAVIFILSGWSIHFVRWLVLPLNLVMMAATPIHGSHYLVDMIVGGFLGGAAFWIGARCLAPRASLRSRSPDEATWGSLADVGPSPPRYAGRAPVA